MLCVQIKHPNLTAAHFLHGSIIHDFNGALFGGFTEGIFIICYESFDIARRDQIASALLNNLTLTGPSQDKYIFVKRIEFIIINLFLF